MYKRFLIVCCLCLIVKISDAQSIGDSTKAIQLSNVDVLSDIAKYSRDSVNMAIIYRKVYEDATRKPTKSVFGDPSPMRLSLGVQYEGLITAFARKISGKQKTDKRFVTDFRRTQAEKYITLKYNPEVVRGIISLVTDSIPVFIQTYPMDEAYARAASPLEIKMWIRSNFKDWVAKQQLISVPDTLRE
jgi:hypothetical protein